MRIPKVLVTGCAGYIGSVLTGYLLRDGCEVIGVDNLSVGKAQSIIPYLTNRDFTFAQADVRNTWEMADLARSCDVIIPLAAIVGAPACNRDVDTATQVNEDSIVGLIKTLSPHQRVVYPNTNSGYGQTDGTSQVTENDPVNPISCYGLTKCAAEKAVLEHPNSVCFRLATVFGVSPRMRLDLLVNDFTYKISHFDAKPFQLFEPHFKRNFVGVRDVSRAFMFMLGYDYTGVYNLGLPTANLSKIELAHRICHVLNVPKEAVYIGKGKDPDQRNYIVSNDKILSTGFKFRHELDDGIREVARLCPLLSPAEILSARNA